MAGADQTGMGHGTTLAIGVLLLWIGGLGLFIAFMSGKSPALTVGTATDAYSGKPVPTGPRNISELIARLAANAQSLEGGVPTVPTWPPTPNQNPPTWPPT